MIGVERYSKVKYEVFRYRDQAKVWQKVIFAVGLASLTGAMAQVRVVLPWSPVPITLQTFVVLLSGVVLGRKWGAISQALYLGIGALGMPWFTGYGSGLQTLAGPTGGYLTGFILAALLIGYFTDTCIKSRSFFYMLGLMVFANFIIIYGLGIAQLSLYLSWVKGVEVNLFSLFWMGVIPFIPGDLTKAIAAAVIARTIAPKQSYNKKIDKLSFTS